jgi:hypothetical protein
MRPAFSSTSRWFPTLPFGCPSASASRLVVAAFSVRRLMILGRVGFPSVAFDPRRLRREYVHMDIIRRGTEHPVLIEARLVHAQDVARLLQSGQMRRLIPESSTTRRTSTTGLVSPGTKEESKCSGHAGSVVRDDDALRLDLPYNDSSNTLSNRIARHAGKASSCNRTPQRVSGSVGRFGDGKPGPVSAADLLTPTDRPTAAGLATAA